jgi:hypothetical protein
LMKAKPIGKEGPVRPDRTGPDRPSQESEKTGGGCEKKYIVGVVV